MVAHSVVQVDIVVVWAEHAMGELDGARVHIGHIAAMDVHKDLHIERWLNQMLVSLRWKDSEYCDMQAILKSSQQVEM